MPLFFFFNDTATTEIYTLSLHDALPISSALRVRPVDGDADDLVVPASDSTMRWPGRYAATAPNSTPIAIRSEEHTSELQSQSNLVCRLLLEKKNNLNRFNVQISGKHATS